MCKDTPIDDTRNNPQHTNFSFNERTAPACLWNNQLKIYKYKIEAAGYGAIDFGDRKSNKLLKLQLKIVKYRDCNGFYKKDNSLTNGITRGQICAKGVPFENMETDTCTSDSGQFRCKDG